MLVTTQSLELNFNSLCNIGLIFSQQVYLSEIRVLLPESWSDQPFYKPNRWERFENSDIRVDVPTTAKGNVPYVNKPTGCGKPGLYLHITPEYLMNEQIGTLFGPYDKVLPSISVQSVYDFVSLNPDSWL